MVADPRHGERRIAIGAGVIGLGILLLVVGIVTHDRGLEVFPVVIALSGLGFVAEGIRRIAAVVEGLWRGVVATVGLWVAFFVVFLLTGGSLDDLPSLVRVTVGLLLLVAWIGLPASLYADATALRGADGWSPWWPLYVLPALVPMVGVVPGAVYLLRRRRKVGVP